jgi:toxin CcdB
MSQFTVYRNEDDSSNETYPYFIDIQNSLLDDLNSRLVIPLSKQSSSNNISAKKLCSVLQVNNDNFVMLTHQMTTVPKSILKTKIISLESYRHEITDAIDFLITGI